MCSGISLRFAQAIAGLVDRQVHLQRPGGRWQSRVKRCGSWAEPPAPVRQVRNDPFSADLFRATAYIRLASRRCRETARSTCSMCGTSPATWISSSFVQRRQ